MLAVIIGLLFAVAGLWGIAVWWADFVIFLKGFLPVMIFCGGIISIFVGITAISDVLKEKKAAEADENIGNTKE